MLSITIVNIIKILLDEKLDVFLYFLEFKFNFN